MLTVLGQNTSRTGFCDGLSRRNFLRIGGLGLAGLALPDLLQADAKAGNASSPKSVIMIYLVGGPPHQDMFDLKPEAPKEIAGPWRPIATNVPGIEICEAFPKLAGMMDKLVPIRSLVGSQAGHDAIQVFNGHHPARPKPSGGWPQFGSAVSKVLGPANVASPPHVSLCYECTHGPYNEPGRGFSGAVLCSVSSLGADAQRHDFERRHAGAPCRPPEVAEQRGSLPPLRRCHWHDGRLGYLHPTSDGPVDLFPVGRCFGSFSRKIRKPWPVTARAIRRSTWMAMEHRACRNLCSWLGD